MAVPDEIARLVERFERNEQAYLQGRYNETQLRREFVDPFFKALGWDVDNTKGWAEAYKDVIHEDAIRLEQTPLNKLDALWKIGNTLHESVYIHVPQFSGLKFVESAAIDSPLSKKAFHRY